MTDETQAGAEPHAVELNAWDVPSAIGAGERFTFCVGARCAAGCDLGGRALGIFDEEGRPVGAAALGGDVWPGTAALHFAEVEATAPLQAGIHRWEARVAGWDAQPPHAPGAFPLAVRVVTAPDCEITVTALDRERQVPIKGARVVMHPYRAVTDDNGTARIRVARGRYDILVSGPRYLPVRSSVEVTADMATSAELEADQPPDDVPE